MKNTNQNEVKTQTAQAFYDWAYKGRAKTIERMLNKEDIPHNEVFLGFTTHTPAFISHGPSGLNGSIKGVGWLPKEEVMPEILAKYKAHIATYSPDDKTYSERGLKILWDCLYSPEAQKHMDFSVVSSIEMAFVHSYENFLANPDVTLLYYQPPAISFEVRGKMQVIGERHDKDAVVATEDLPLLQQFVNAQHDMYHAANVARWKTRPVYLIKIQEIYNNGLGPNGFGKKMDLIY